MKNIFILTLTFLLVGSLSSAFAYGYKPYKPLKPYGPYGLKDYNNPKSGNCSNRYGLKDYHRGC